MRFFPAKLQPAYLIYLEQPPLWYVAFKLEHSMLVQTNQQSFSLTVYTFIQVLY